MTDLSTQPTDLASADRGIAEPAVGTPTGPAQPDPRPVARSWTGSVKTTWYRFTSMRTALILLFLMAVASVPGSVLPQRGLNPIKVSAFLAAHPALGPFLDRLSLFDVFAAPWFAAIYLLLFLSLAGCVLPRAATHARASRARPPRAPKRLTRMPTARSDRCQAGPTEVAAAAESVLRRHRYRTEVTTEPDGAMSVAGEKGHLRETGNLVFHLALLGLLLGIALGGLFGYKGTVLVKEGDGFSNTVAQYDTFHPGRMVDGRRLAPFTLTLDRFAATWRPNGAPASFSATVSYDSGVGTGGAASRGQIVRVNHPLRVDRSKVYLIGHGYAPTFTVHGPDGSVVFSGSVPFLPQDATFTSNGVVKVPDIAPGADGQARQLGFTGFFTPTTILSPDGVTSSFPAAKDPAVTLLAWRGDLGVDSGIPQNVYALDTARMKRVRDAQGRPVAATLRPGQTLTLPTGAGSITFDGYKQWATLQVTYDPGKTLALLSAVFVVVGLVTSLTVRRRRIWLRARPAGAAEHPEDGDAADVEAALDVRDSSADVGERAGEAGPPPTVPREATGATEPGGPWAAAAGSGGPWAAAAGSGGARAAGAGTTPGHGPADGIRSGSKPPPEAAGAREPVGAGSGRTVVEAAALSRSDSDPVGDELAAAVDETLAAVAALRGRAGGERPRAVAAGG